MKLRNILVLLIFGLSSCHQSSKINEYSAKTSEDLIIKAKSNQLSNDDYFVILSQLDGMFEIVYSKAHEAKKNGICNDSIRKYLASDTEYVIIAQQAVVLDSVLTKYIKSPNAPQNLRNKYFKVSSQAAKRSQRVGLN